MALLRPVAVAALIPYLQATRILADTVPSPGRSFLQPSVRPPDTTFLLGRDSVPCFGNQLELSSNLCQLACCMVLVSIASPPLRKRLRSFRWLMRPTSVLLEVSASGYLPQHHLGKQVKVQVLWLRLGGGWAPEPALKSAPPGDPYACRA